MFYVVFTFSLFTHWHHHHYHLLLHSQQHLQRERQRQTLERELAFLVVLSFQSDILLFFKNYYFTDLFCCYLLQLGGSDSLVGNWVVIRFDGYSCLCGKSCGNFVILYLAQKTTLYSESLSSSVSKTVLIAVYSQSKQKKLGLVFSVRKKAENNSVLVGGFRELF